MTFTQPAMLADAAQDNVHHRPVRVLHLIHWLTVGGVERWLVGALKEVERKCYAMDFCCQGSIKGQLAPSVESLGAKVWHLPLDITHFRYIHRLRMLLQRERYDIVHNHLTVYAGVPTLTASLLGIPTIVSFHNTDFSATAITNPVLRGLRDLYARVSIPLAIDRARFVTGCSAAVLESVDREYHLYSKMDRARILYYGVEVPPVLSNAQKRAIRDELNVSPDATLIAHVGRFDQQKNHTGLLRIARKLVVSHANSRFILVGDGPLRPLIEAEIGQLHLSMHVKLLGIRHDVERILSAADILLFPSKWEGFPVVVLEASAASLPVVGSDLPGLRESVVDGETGFLLPAGDTDKFVHTLARLIGDDALRQRMGAAGRERILRHFSRRATSQVLTALYAECLSKGALTAL